VGELLDRGADVEGLVGELHTTPLQWAIWHKKLEVVRFLLGWNPHHDHINHVNKLGWSMLFFCWSRLRFDQPCMLDFLHMLEENAHQEYNAEDTLGWTVLDRVAACGRPEAVLALINYGADADHEATPLR
jgi:ankyrin repeat protein